jgi:hypothetical protein
VTTPLSRRDLLRSAALAAASLALPAPLVACARRGAATPRPDGDVRQRPPAGNASDADLERLAAWSAALHSDGLARRDVPLGRAAARVGELAVGTPYVAYELEAYLRAGGSPTSDEPLTLSLTRFDCVSLVESCLAVARAAEGDGPPSWERFAREVERMRYREGERKDYASRLHYFSDWIADGARRGLVRDMGAELGGTEDARPLRFMSEHRGSYPALSDDGAYAEIGAMERRLDGQPRRVIPTARIPEVAHRIESGDVLAFATAIPGLDVTHSALAYRDRAGVLRVLHAPLSGGSVEVSRRALPEYVAAIKRSTGILVARPLRG